MKVQTAGARRVGTAETRGEKEKAAAWGRRQADFIKRGASVPSGIPPAHARR